MRIRDYRRLIVWMGGCSAASLVTTIVQGDVVTLNTGGLVRGNIVPVSAGNGPKAVAVRTHTGGLIVVEQQAVQQIKRGGNSAKKPAPKGGASKQQLTPEQQAWMPRIRALVKRLLGDDPNQRRRARAELLKIDDPDAIPALSRYLGSDPSEEARRLYVQILRNMPGTNPVYGLVSLSLFDPSPQVRDEARKAIGPQRADAARPLYIEALKTREPNLASLAARGIAEIGDPKGDAIPYLIENLVFQTRRLVATPPQLIAVPRNEVTTNNDDAREWGIHLFRKSISPWGPSTPPMGGSATPPMGGMGTLGWSAPRMPMGGGHRWPNGGDIMDSGFDPTGWSPNSKQYRDEDNWWRKYQQGRGTGGLPVVFRDVPAKSHVVRYDNENPAVRDALVKITDQKFAYNRDNWRRWWAADQKDREAQKGAPPDRIAPKSPDQR